MKNKLYPKDTIVVVGAGRSGTTMIKDALGTHPDLAPCPYELNYLWRYGNADLDHDMLDVASHYSDKSAAYIQKKLFQTLAESEKPRLVEKTVANVIRIAYVNAILPDAKIVHVIRDGRAVVSSAMQRWRAAPPPSYFLSKAGTIPLADLPRIGIRYLLQKMKGIFRKRDYIQSWGPRWPGLDDDVKNFSLAEVCALQWMNSVKEALKQKDRIPPELYLEVRYEELVNNPLETFGKIARFVDIDPNAESFHIYLSTKIKSGGLDKWKKTLTTEEIALVEGRIGSYLGELGYK